MSYKNVKKENSPINIYNRFKTILKTGIEKDEKYDSIKAYSLYLIESNWINKWKKFISSKNKKQNNKNFNEPCKIINNLEQALDAIKRGEKIELVDSGYINSIKKKYLNNLNDNPILHDIYLGNHKILIIFKNYYNYNNIDILIENIISSENSKYYLTTIYNDYKIQNIKSILNIPNNSFEKKIKNNKYNLAFISLNEHKEIKNDYQNLNKQKENKNIPPSIQLNPTLIKNTQNINNNIDNKEEIPEEQITNNNINEPYEPEKIKKENIKKEIQKEETQSNINSEVINNDNDIINENLDNNKRIKEEEEKNKEKEEYYEIEKIRIQKEKIINSKFSNDLSKTYYIILEQLNKKYNNINNDIIILKNEINDLDSLIDHEEKVFNKKFYFDKNKNFKQTKEQKINTEKFEKRLQESAFLEKNKKNENYLKKKIELEKKLAEKNKELLDIMAKIKETEKKCETKESNEYLRNVLENNILDNNLLEKELTNIINKDKEELLKVQKVTKKIKEEQAIIKEKELLEKKRQREKETKEIYEKMKKEEAKKLILEEKKKEQKLKEKADNMHKKKIEDLNKKAKSLQEKTDERYKEINQNNEEKRKKILEEKEENLNKIKKIEEQRYKEEKEKNKNIKNENDELWKKEIKNIEEIRKRQKMEETNLKNLININEKKLEKEEELFKNKNKLEEIKEEEIEQKEFEDESILEKERIEKERLEKERFEKERIEKERIEKERIEKEIIEKERLEKERIEKERLEKEKAEKERLDKENKERIKKERIEKELKFMKEKQERERERLEKERIEKEILFKKKKEEEIKQLMLKKQEEEKIKKLKILEEEKKKKEAEEKIKKQMEEQKKIEEEIKKQKELKEKIKKQKQKELEEQIKQQKQKELEQQKKEDEIKKKKIFTCNSLPSPPLIGLQNIGSTCYMNATLQCFSHTEVLTNYFLNENNYSRIYNNNIAKYEPMSLQLSPSYLDLINNLWKKKQKWYPPTEFRKRLADMNSLFKEGTPNDAKDLLTYILMQLHDELNLYDAKNSNNNNFNGDENVSQYNEAQVLQNFVKSFFGTNKSVLSDHFFGIQESKFLCLGCAKRFQGFNPPFKYNFQTFNFLIFPLEEIRIFKSKNNMSNNMLMINNMYLNQFNMNNMNPFGGNNIIINNIILPNNNNNSVTIYDCFNYFQKEEIFQGDNAMWCNDCNGLIPCKNNTIIYTGPNILIIILNRGVGIQFKVKLEFYESINLDNYIAKKDRINMIYDLYGVVTHLGESGASGHFVAACKSPCKDNRWYRFNDAIVTPINNIQSDIINFGMPYILFYKKRA